MYYGYCKHKISRCGRETEQHKNVCCAISTNCYLNIFCWNWTRSRVWICDTFILTWCDLKDSVQKTARQNCLFLMAAKLPFSYRHAANRKNNILPKITYSGKAHYDIIKYHCKTCTFITMAGTFFCNSIQSVDKVRSSIIWVQILNECITVRSHRYNNWRATTSC